ncbi:MAG: sensor histidine kinase, partial [Gemmatimonadaceae bacterium]
EQVFSNLIENAVRHTPRGGVITVNAVMLRNGQISVGVHNTGSVIPKDDLPRVFERFFQVDRARTRKGGSSGLGLSIVAEIVEAHDGKVRVISDAERGTEFIVTLPSALETTTETGRTPAKARPKRVRRQAHESS